MHSFDWESFLRQWSQAILAAMSAEQIAHLPPEIIETAWLGYPGATENQISQAESRLGVKLPPSYREFLQVTNGWRQTTPFIRRLWSTEDIERFAVRHEKWIEAFISHHENTQTRFEDSIEVDTLWEPPTIADSVYFVYGKEQDCSKLRLEYLKTALEISDVGDASIYLLNPQVVTAAGEWEAWFFGDWLPGADRYPSFQAMMEAEYQNFLDLRDFAAGQREPLADSNPLATVEPSIGNAVAIPAALEPLTSAATISDLWRSQSRLIVEFQARQQGAQIEYRTMATAEGELATTWPGLRKRDLQRWLQVQLNRGMDQPIEGIVASAATVHPEPKPSLILPSQPFGPRLDLTLDLTQLTLRQDSRFSDPIVVTLAAPNPRKKPGHAALSSHKPFSLELAYTLVGPDRDALLFQAVTYQVQCHAQNRTTGKWLALGETRLEALSPQQLTYTAYLFEKGLEVGMYRLQVLTLLRGAATALTTFEVPLLTVA